MWSFIVIDCRWDRVNSLYSGVLEKFYNCNVCIVSVVSKFEGKEIGLGVA